MVSICYEQQDARKFTPAAQYEIRKQVIMAYRRARPYSGSDQRGSGLSNQAMRPIVKRFRESKDQTVSILSAQDGGWGGAPARAGSGKHDPAPDLVSHTKKGYRYANMTPS